MRSFVRIAGVALFLAVGASCRDTLGPKSLVSALLVWRAQNISSYSYVGSKACFCVGPEGPVTVQVAAGKVVGVTEVSTGAEVPIFGWLTVDELFDLAERNQPIRLEFDRRLGFPTLIVICCLADDSGISYAISELHPTAGAP